MEKKEVQQKNKSSANNCAFIFGKKIQRKKTKKMDKTFGK